MHPLQYSFLEQVRSGLSKRSISACSQWAENYRVMGKPFPGAWSFKYHPWLREMHDTTTPFLVGMKAAQMGYTECLLNRTFYEIDIHGHNCLYVLPNQKPDASVFSASRFDPALEASPHLQRLFSDVRNVDHKRAGTANLFVRGARSRSGLKSVPAAFIAVDELEEMADHVIPLAKERSSGQLDSFLWTISTPFIFNCGIHELYSTTTQEHFFFPCPSCGKRIELTYPDSAVMDTDDPHYICTLCQTRLPEDMNAKATMLSKAEWVPSKPISQSTGRGFHINQMYSPTITPLKLQESVTKAQTNAADEQELYNSKLGLPHIPDGAAILDSDIVDCISPDRRMRQLPTNTVLVTMGVDVGKLIYYEVDAWLPNGVPVPIDTGHVRDFPDLDVLMYNYRVNYCVIDANPEFRLAFQFAERFNGLVSLCYYNYSCQGRQITRRENEDHTITVNRTSWLDLSLGRFKKKLIALPLDISEEYKHHIKAPVRVMEKTKNGDRMAVYREGSKDDHLAHARNYAEIAMDLGSSNLRHSTIHADVL